MRRDNEQTFYRFRFWCNYLHKEKIITEIHFLELSFTEFSPSSLPPIIFTFLRKPRQPLNTSKES